MNIEKLNQAFVQIVEKKNELAGFDPGDPHHDVLEEEVHEIEKKFLREYGSYIEEALFHVHDEFCPDNDVLLPVSYMASQYLVYRQENKVVFDVDKSQGIPVDADDFPGVRARLVLIPSPTRLVLQGEKDTFKEVVWVARQPLEA